MGEGQGVVADFVNVNIEMPSKLTKIEMLLGFCATVAARLSVILPSISTKYTKP